jgi:RNA polymerase sigma factor (sigma-70 family)
VDCSKLSDADLLKACLDDEREAWQAFVIRFSKLIYHSLYRTFKAKNFSSDSQVIDDLYQEVFLSLVKDKCKKMRQFKGKNKCSLASWLRMIAARTAIDFPDGDDLIDTLSNGRELPDKSIEKLEWYQLLRKLIEDFSPKDRYFFELCYNQELPDNEIAQILNLSIDVVYMRKNRIKNKLMTIIKRKKLA